MTSVNRKSKALLSVYNALKIFRRRRKCVSCKNRSFPIDAILGLPKRYSEGLKERVAYSIVLSAYRGVGKTLKKFLGFSLSPTTIGNIADETASEMDARLKSNPDVRKNFQAAKGETEVQIDGTCINTRNAEGKQEYRDVKIAAAIVRECGDSATPSEWDTRELPEPNAVYAVAAIEETADDRRQTAVNFTIEFSCFCCYLLSAVCYLLYHVFGRASECLDIYHAVENISALGKSLYGSGKKFDAWLDSMRMVLLSKGLDGIECELLAIKKGLKPDECKPIDSLLEYLRKNSDRLPYSERLATGRAIGSGLIEGACKNLIGKRLKQTKACWRVPRANKIAIICAIMYSDQWEQAWHNSS
jgi:hypothetical protein